MKTIILLAGHATRMRPLTTYLNKGMIPLRGRPLLEHVIERLRTQGFTDLLVAVTMFPEQLENYFGDGSRFGVRIQYVLRPHPSQTAGEVAALRDLLAPDESFLVHYGDILTNLNIAAMADQHAQTGAAATLGLVTHVEIHTGVAELDTDGRVIHFVEKPPLEQPCHAAVNIFSPKVWDYVGPGKDFGHDVIPEMVAAGEDVRGYLDEEAYWMDVGRLSDLDGAEKLLAELEK
ncbi:MAG: nucleotidyltransferase family protein [Armatimonadetes bacterium]|nr:nucleotidyltransferase family protein [Armatimonadota bacterium]